MTTYAPAQTETQPFIDTLCEPGAPHEHLADAPIVVAFVDPPQRSKGAVVAGKASLKQGLAAWLYWLDRPLPDNPTVFGDQVLVIELSAVHWSYYGLLEDGDERRQHLIDHELAHFRLSEDEPGYELRPHDAEIFYDVLARYPDTIKEDHKRQLAGRQPREPRTVSNFEAIMRDTFGDDVRDMNVDPETGEILIVKADDSD